MKKLLFVAAMGVAGMVSAKKSPMFAENKTLPKIEHKKKAKKSPPALCVSYGMVLTCNQQETYYDTVCGTPSEIRECMNHNWALLNEFMCG